MSRLSKTCTRRNWKAILLGLLVIISVGCAGGQQTEGLESEFDDLPVGKLDSADLKADGVWGAALDCKSIPELDPLVDPKITISLDGLTLRLVDASTGFVRVYPVGVGAIDTEVGSLTFARSLSMFPVMHKKRKDFTIKIAATNACRIWWRDPETRKKLPVFAGMPFLRFWGGYGIHGPITGYTQRSGGYLKRAYVSHGCIRMEAKDIVEVWALIRGVREVNVRVQEEIDRRADGSAYDIEQKWILSECTTDDECNFEGGFCKRNKFSGRGFCTAACSRVCDYDKIGYPVTFCVPDSDSSDGQGFCTYKRNDENYSCRRFDGFVARDRVSRHNQPAKKANVCLPSSEGWVGDLCEVETDCQAGLGCKSLGSGQIGVCTTPCTKFCDDQTAFAATFCIENADGSGDCVKRCDPSQYASSCPGGFSCLERSRFSQSDVKRHVCIPN